MPQRFLASSISMSATRSRTGHHFGRSQHQRMHPMAHHSPVLSHPLVFPHGPHPTGWATALSTPFKMFKRYTYQGGVCDPLVITWPAGIEAKGEVRNQYHHAVDIVPTIFECCGVEFPDTVMGYTQTPLPGVSIKYSLDDGNVPTNKKIQYYEMLGTRAL